MSTNKTITERIEVRNRWIDIGIQTYFIDGKMTPTTMSSWSKEFKRLEDLEEFIKILQEHIAEVKAVLDE